MVPGRMEEEQSWSTAGLVSPTLLLRHNSWRTTDGGASSGSEDEAGARAPVNNSSTASARVAVDGEWRKTKHE